MQYLHDNPRYKFPSLFSLPLLSQAFGFSLFLILIAFSFSVHADNQLTTDHPLMSRFQGAETFYHHFYDYIAVELPVAPVNELKSNDNILHVEGRASFITYTLPKSTSQLAFIKVIKHQLARSKFSLVFECQHNDNSNTCGKQLHNLSRSERFRNGFQFSCGNDEDFYLLTAKITRNDNKNTYLYLCSEDGKVNQTIVEEKDIDFNKITISSQNYQPSNNDLNAVMPSGKKDKEKAEDHPLISRFPNSVITGYSELDFGQAKLPIKTYSRDDKAQVNLSPKDYYVAIEGKGTFIEYRLPDGLSQYQVMQNYLQALKASNMEILLRCVGEDECGKDGLSDRIGVQYLMPGLAYGNNCDDSGALITAKISIGENRQAYLFLCIDNSPWGTVSQTIIEEKTIDFNKITLNSQNYQPSTNDLNAVVASGKKDKEKAKDHPLISRFPHSVITGYQELDFGQAKLPIKTYDRDDKAQVNLSPKDYYIAIEGKGTFIKYRLPEGLSQYQVVQNYLQALKASNMEILLSCVGEDECGEDGLSDKTSTRHLMPGLVLGDNCHNSAALITARTLIGENRYAYLFLCIGSYPFGTVSQTIIEEKSLVTGLITLSAMELENTIAAKGKVAVYGILFNSNSASILPTSAPVISQVAQLLTNKPQLKLYVVGHTDGQGKEAYNQTLSQQRAQAIIKVLITQYGIAAQRLQARGVGELVPVSTNNAKEGRQLNRRVELVEI